jgi:hypothetical protein
MKEYIAPLLRFGALILLLTTIYEQNKTITHQKGEIKALMGTIEKTDSAASKQLDELEHWKKQYDSLYGEHWSLKTYTDIKEGRAEE